MIGRGLLWILVAVWFVVVATPCTARVTGLCANCHTMHNSQNNVAVNSSGPNNALLNSNCAGCHQGQNTGTNTTPYVFDPNGPVYGSTGTETQSNTLAGGNFYWVAQGYSATGHNVAGITSQDSRLGNTPPGGSALGGRLTCAGVNGCHGDRSIGDGTEAMLGSHHYNDSSVWKDGSTVANSYRFLKGIQGLEDTTYEYHPTASSHHNKYYGLARSSETDTAAGTISSLCAECHGDFHDGNGSLVPSSGTFGSGVWVRHPTDFDMASAQSSTEYQGYNGGTGVDNPYSVISPVATADKTTALNTTVYSQTGDAIVMCISCHRAHGSPFDASLRWDYKSWPGGGYNGCAVCHTTKD